MRWILKETRNFKNEEEEDLCFVSLFVVLRGKIKNKKWFFAKFGRRSSPLDPTHFPLFSKTEKTNSRVLFHLFPLPFLFTRFVYYIITQKAHRFTQGP